MSIYYIYMYIQCVANIIVQLHGTMKSTKVQTLGPGNALLLKRALKAG